MKTKLVLILACMALLIGCASVPKSQTQSFDLNRGSWVCPLEWEYPVKFQGIELPAMLEPDYSGLHFC